jgi:hypothetical protein
MPPSHIAHTMRALRDSGHVKLEPGGFSNMPTKSTTQSPSWSHLLFAAGGIAFGSWLARGQMQESKKSRAEIDDPEGAEEIYSEIGDLLDAWEPKASCVTEDEFTRDLAEWLEENTEWEIELYPNTREGKPDILVGDLLALELKCFPSKGEMDRCIGQCAAYSRRWITWMVIVDASVSKVGRLEDLLADKGLEQIEVWQFS